MDRKLLRVGGLSITALLLMAAFIVWGAPDGTLKGSLIEPPLPVADFTLTDQHGQTFRLGEHTDKIVLVFFGYTTCPDVCPTTLAEAKQVINLLGKQSDQVVVVFVTVDPDRDTPEKMAGYLSLFNPDFIGLTGSSAQLQAVYDDFGVYRSVQDSGSAAGYLVDHTARLYLLQNQGIRLSYAFPAVPEDVASDIETLLKNND